MFHMERHASEEEWIKRAESEVKAKLSYPENEVGWIRWVGEGKFRKVAKEGDTFIDLYSTNVRRKRVVASSPASILKRQDVGNWTRFYYEIRQDGKEMAWTEFNWSLRRLGIRNITKNSTRESTPRETALIDTIWNEQD